MRSISPGVILHLAAIVAAFVLLKAPAGLAKAQSNVAQSNKAQQDLAQSNDARCHGNILEFESWMAACATTDVHASDRHARALALVARGYASYREGLSRHTQVHPLVKIVAVTAAKFDDAIRDYSDAIRILGKSPEAAVVFSHRAIAYGHMGERDKAIRDFGQAIRLKPDYAEAYFMRGLGYSLDHAYGKAVADFGHALQVEPRNTIYLLSRAEAYLAMGRLEKALVDYDQIGRSDNDRVPLVWTDDLQRRHR
jgi:tetratricopeptide (TPR) repeat protein